MTMGSPFGPGRWDWTRSKKSAEAMLKERNKPSKVKDGPFEKLIDIILTCVLIGAVVYFIFNLFF